MAEEKPLDDREVPAKGTHMLRIYPDDLAELERILPGIFDIVMVDTAKGRCMESRGPELRTKWRKVQTILSNVRWDYGPPSEVEIIPVGDEPE